MAKVHKKTVSFSDNESSSNEHGEEKGAEWEKQLVVRDPSRVGLVPVHLGLLAYSIARGPMAGGELDGSLLTHLYYLVPSQLVYAVWFTAHLHEHNTRTRKAKQLGLRVSRDLNIVVTGLLLSLVLILPIYTGLVLFGAPFSTLQRETLLLALHLDYLLLPVLLAYFKSGFNARVLRLLVPVVAALWLSTVVIPLDWDREWQTWPLPLVFGGYAGAVCAYSLAWLFI